MTERVYNFGPGPAVLPVSVLEEARDNLLSLGQTGIGILEHSHRGKVFSAILEEAKTLCRELASISDDYEVLFLQGGASTQFFSVPMSFLPSRRTADYLVTGSWSKKALAEAKRLGEVHVACTSEDRNFTYIPAERNYSQRPVYVHFTSNNTIFGTQFSDEPEVPDGAFLACDASSDIFSRPIDVGRYGIVYAGAQKNLGPAGLTLVIIRKDLVERGASEIPTFLQYRTHAETKSAYNTPPVFCVYVMSLVLKWIKEQGGLQAVETRNREKAGRLYRCLDESRLFKPTAETGSRSMMNLTFVTGDKTLDAKFVEGAEEAGMAGLKGHRSVGGMRASLYNAFPPDGVDALVAFMRDFEAVHG